MKISNILLRKLFSSSILIGILIIGVSGCSGSEEASTPPPGDDQNKPTGPTACLQDFGGDVTRDLAQASSIKGGRIYDKWWAELGSLEPSADNTHPLWSLQSTNTRTGPDTWRCKECHGWDYKGVDGVYGDNTNSHYTGFIGILDAQSKDPVEVFCAIRSGTDIDARHSFSDLGYVNLLHLTKFITDTTGEGLIDSNIVIDPITGDASGNNITGKDLFESTPGCSSANCHGLDGAARGDHSVGELAVENPWEVLHKIRFGHPASNMPAYADNSPSNFSQFTITEISHVIRYAQIDLGGSTPDPDNGGTTPPPTSVIVTTMP